MTTNDYTALEYLSKCSGWTEPPLDRAQEKVCPRFMSSIGYLLLHGLAESRSLHKVIEYRITKDGRQALADRGNGTVSIPAPRQLGA